MDELAQDNFKKDNNAKKGDPADLPLWTIFKSLTSGQFYGMFLVLIGLFGGGYAVGQWASSAGHERELAEEEEDHRRAISAKDEVIAIRDDTIDDLETELDTTRQNVDDVVQVASAADQNARLYRAKAEFLNRYLSYLEEPSGAMRKLFADHVCVLWRETQRDIFSVNSSEITSQQVLRSTGLSTTSLEALAAAGVDPQMIDEYWQLNRRRSQIERRATSVEPRQPTVSPFNVSPRPQVDRSAEAKLRRLQSLEDRIGNAIGSGITTKTVMFFDGSRYMIPLPVATDVHERTDCQS